MKVIPFKIPGKEEYVPTFQKIENRWSDLMDSIIEWARQEYLWKHGALLEESIVDQATHKVWLEMSDILDYIFEEEYDEESYSESNHAYIYSVIKTRLNKYPQQALEVLEEQRAINREIWNNTLKK